MAATLSRYSVPGWGVGELWTLDEVVLAHDFDYFDELDDAASVSAASGIGAHLPKGAASPPSSTVASNVSRTRDVFVPKSHQGNGSGKGSPATALPALIARYLEGEPVTLGDVELDLAWATPFQRAVACALRNVPRGEVVTYGELAALAGYPGAARAAGSFCATNRFALLVPCHRVVGASGIGGYGATGIVVKRRLLALEGVVV